MAEFESHVPWYGVQTLHMTEILGKRERNLFQLFAIKKLIKTGQTFF